jgi:hypothetical protein
MKKAYFWKHIELSKRSDPEEHVERLVNRLSKLSPLEILHFQKWWNSVRDAAYTWKLWGVAYLMNGGCSDDGFVYFRDWLILKGEAIYTAALKDPDTLSKVRVEPREAECECYPAMEAYCEAIDSNDSGLFYKAYAEAFGREDEPASEDPNVKPKGKSWDFDDDDEMRKRYPKLFDRMKPKKTKSKRKKKLVWMNSPNTRKPSLEALAKLARKLDVAFPTAYLDVASLYNGGTPMNNRFFDPNKQKDDIDMFLQYPKEILQYLKFSSGRLPEKVVPFAVTLLSDAICFDFRGEGEPKIVFWDQTTKGIKDDKRLNKLAESFEAFMDSLFD